MDGVAVRAIGPILCGIKARPCNMIFVYRMVLQEPIFESKLGQLISIEFYHFPLKTYLESKAQGTYVYDELHVKK